MTSFNDLALIAELKKAIAEEGYTTPTPIQVQSIPELLKGRDILACAQTGTGKTAAFTLPILQHLCIHKKPIQRGLTRVLILAPTRELAAQIGDSIKTYGRYLHLKSAVIFGGVGQFPQVQALSRGVDILVATPGRLLDLMQQGHVKLHSVEIFVLDEADRMLDMGFINDIKKVIAKLPLKKQSLFFSATLEPEVVALAKTLVHNPVHVTITPESPTVDKIAQGVYFVDKEQRDRLLRDVLKDPQMKRVIIFTLMKHVANKVARMLEKAGIPSAAIHGNKSQNARTQALADFKSGKVRVLVATDIAARGIDVDGISHVINYELPNTPETYVHRIGRTARAGTDGDALSFCTASEREYLRAIEKLINKKILVVEHELHSDFAMNATGQAARPLARGGRTKGHTRKRVGTSTRHFRRN